MIRFSDRELEALLNDTESDSVERKESFKGDVPKKARQAVCAFANDLPGHNHPGVLFIGAKDNGEPSGICVDDQLLLSLANIKTDGNILPLPVLVVEKRILKGAEMAVVTVLPSDMPPVKYDGRIWIRTGPRRSIANEQEERILNEKRRYKEIPYDLRPVTSATLADLSRAVFEDEYLPAAFAPDILEANNRTYEERLASCKMIVSPDDPTPTVLGILALGKNPQQFLPGAYVQFLRINGTELADPVADEATIKGKLTDMIRRTEEKLKAHNRTSVDILSRLTHRMESLYPHAAFQQILINAVLHRAYENTNAPIRVYWFNDRIEINSPGGPYGNVTAENFGKPGITDYRNPNIADVLKTFGFIQAFGRGIATARQEMKDNGHPEPLFDVTSSAVVCTLAKKYMHVDLEELGENGCPKTFPFPKEGEHCVVRIPYSTNHQAYNSIAREYLQVAYCIETLSESSHIAYCKANEQNTLDCFVDVTLQIQDQQKTMASVRHLSEFYFDDIEESDRMNLVEELDSFYDLVQQKRDNATDFAAPNIIESFWLNCNMESEEDSED